MSRLSVRGIGKSWRGKDCAYCASAAAASVDHVFAKAFFPVAKRANLPQAPACLICADAKSRLETDLACILPLAGEHEDARELVELAFGRLRENKRVLGNIAPTSVAVSSRASLLETRLELGFSIDGASVCKLLEFIVRGLHYHHWNEVVPSHYIADAKIFPQRESYRLSEALSRFRTLGPMEIGDAFTYEVARDEEDTFSTLWRIQMLGGARAAFQSPDTSIPPTADFFVVVDVPPPEEIATP